MNKIVLCLGLFFAFSVNAYAYSCGGGGASTEEKCNCIQEVRENIRSQQRQNSTQRLRDDYRFWTDEYHKTCSK